MVKKQCCITEKGGAKGVGSVLGQDEGVLGRHRGVLVDPMFAQIKGFVSLALSVLQSPHELLVGLVRKVYEDQDDLRMKSL